MKCKKAQDIILTDYMDKCIEPQQRTKIDEHLKKCKKCREFLNMARKKSIDPFCGVSQESVPADVWSNIEGMIVSHKRGRSKNKLTELMEKLRGILMPKPVFVLSSVFSLMLIVGLLIRPFVLQRSMISMEDKQAVQIEYMAYLMGYSDQTEQSSYDGYGTSIEEMFIY